MLQGLFQKKISQSDAVSAGQRDGSRLHPPLEWDGVSGRISAFEKQVTEVANNMIAEQVRIWQTNVTRQIAEIKTLRGDLMAAITNYRMVLKEHQFKFFQAIRPESKHRKETFYKVSLVLLVLLEIFVNIYTLKFLRETGVMTIILGFVLGLILPLAGYRAGMLLKSKEKSLTEIVITSAMLIAGVGLLIGIASARKLWIEGRGQSEEVVSEAFWLFLFLNLLFFLFAIIDGFFAGYLYPRLYQAWDEIQRKKRQFFNRWFRLGEATSKVAEQIKKTKADAEQYKSIYQEENRIARQAKSMDSSAPAYFDGSVPLPIDIPDQMEPLLEQSNPGESFIASLRKDHNIIDFDEIEAAIQSLEEKHPG